MPFIQDLCDCAKAAGENDNARLSELSVVPWATLKFRYPDLKSKSVSLKKPINEFTVQELLTEPKAVQYLTSLIEKPDDELIDQYAPMVPTGIGANSKFLDTSVMNLRISNQAEDLFIFFNAMVPEEPCTLSSGASPMIVAQALERALSLTEQWDDMTDDSFQNKYHMTKQKFTELRYLEALSGVHDEYLMEIIQFENYTRKHALWDTAKGKLAYDTLTVGVPIAITAATFTAASVTAGKMAVSASAKLAAKMAARKGAKAVVEHVAGDVVAASGEIIATGAAETAAVAATGSTAVAVAGSASAGSAALAAAAGVSTVLTPIALGALTIYSVGSAVKYGVGLTKSKKKSSGISENEFIRYDKENYDSYLTKNEELEEVLKCINKLLAVKVASQSTDMKTLCYNYLKRKGFTTDEECEEKITECLDLIPASARERSERYATAFRYLDLYFGSLPDVQG